MQCSFFQSDYPQDLPVSDQKRKDTLHAERAVYHNPEPWNAPDGTENERQWHQHKTGDLPELYHPDIPDRIMQRTDERHCDSQVGERPPVRSVEHEGVFLMDLVKPMVKEGDPGCQIEPDIFHSVEYHFPGTQVLDRIILHLFSLC